MQLREKVQQSVLAKCTYRSSAGVDARLSHSTVMFIHTARPGLLQYGFAVDHNCDDDVGQNHNEVGGAGSGLSYLAVTDIVLRSAGAPPPVPTFP